MVKYCLLPLMFALGGPLATGLFAQGVLFEIESPTPSAEFSRNGIGVGDQNGDGTPDILIGSNRDNTNGVAAGAARLFSGVDGSLMWETFGDFEGDHMGSTLGDLGDLNGDGVSDFAVASNGSDFNADHAAACEYLLEAVLLSCLPFTALPPMIHLAQRLPVLVTSMAMAFLNSPRDLKGQV